LIAGRESNVFFPKIPVLALEPKSVNTTKDTAAVVAEVRSSRLNESSAEFNGEEG
jgi:hypothetical protein